MRIARLLKKYHLQSDRVVAPVDRIRSGRPFNQEYVECKTNQQGRSIALLRPEDATFVTMWNVQART